MTLTSSMSLSRFLGAACLILAAYQGIPPILAQTQTVAAGPSYADLADQVTASTIVAKAQIVEAIALPKAQQQGVPAGFKRTYVEARVAGLIRGEGGIAPTISFLYDAPLDAKGKAPKLKKRVILLFAQRGTQPGQVRLVSRYAMMDWTAPAEATVKSIVSELLSSNPAPRITGVGDAFYVAGTIAGEGETQIFLKTENGQPVSLSIVSRPGEAKRWAVALGEIVDEAAAAPRPGTLLWYRLACGLPRMLPATSVRTLSATDAEAARQDYAVVLAGLGRCDRTRAAQ